MTWNLFANATTITTPQFDQNFAELAGLAPIACGVSGTNTLALSPLAGSPPVPALGNYMPFSGIVATTNTGSVTAAIGSLSALNVYKDTNAGPVLLTGKELVAGTYFILTYDGALNSGAGGFHLATGPAKTTSFITRLLTTTASITFSPVGASTTSDITIALTGCSVNDVVMIGPPASITAGLNFTGYVSAAGVVSLRASNVTGASITPATATYRVTTMGFT